MKGIFKFLIVLGCVIVIPVGAAYACFYDGSRKAVTYDENFSTENFASTLMNKSMKNTKSTGKINIDVTADDFNNLIHAAFNKANQEISQYIDAAYVEIDGNNYVFNVGVKVPAFKTKIQLVTTLSAVKDEEGRDSYVFTINDCKLGRINGFSSVTLNILRNFIDDATVENALSESGIHMKVSLEEGKITYYEEDIITDMSKLVTSESESDEDEVNEAQLLFSVASDFLSNDYLVLSTEDQLSGVIDLQPFTKNDSGLLDATKSQNLDLDTVASQVESLWSASIIDKDHLNNTFEYLVHGYEACDEDAQAYLKEKDFTSIGIADVQTYDGIVNKTKRSLIDIIGEKTTSLAELAVNKSITFMTEGEANDYIAGSGFIGYTYVLANEDEKDVSYITVDNFYGNLYRKDDVGYFSVVAGLNFNGYETSIAFDLRQNESKSSDYVMAFTIDSIWLGEYKTSGTLSSYLFKMMAASLAGDETIKVDNDAKTISIDFSDSIDAATKAAVAMIGTPKMTVEGDNLADDNGRVVAVIA